MTTSGMEYNETILDEVKTLSTRVESLEKITNGEVIIMPDGTEYGVGDFGYADTAVAVYIQDNAPSGLNSSTDVGNRWYDSNDNNTLYAWDGFNWINIATNEIYHGAYDLASLGPALVSRSMTQFTIYVQGTAPASPAHGTVWKDTASGNAIKYYDSTTPAGWETVTDQNTINAVNNTLSGPLADVSDNQLTVFYQTAAPGGRNATTHRGDVWYDTDNSYKRYTWDGAGWVEGTGTIVQPDTDGNPPSSSPTATVRAGIGSLFVTWPAVTNADQIWYNLYISTTTPVAKNTTTFLGVQYGTFVVIQKLPDGTALQPGTTYYVKIVAVDPDGPGPDGTEGNGQISTIDINQFEASVKEDIQKIDTVQATAEGKNKAYYQTSMPTGGTYVLNDMWFDTDDGYKPYYYNGTTFTAYQFSTPALATGAVTTGILAAGAVTADKISANSVTADALVIGAIGEGLLMNGSFETDANADGKPDAWHLAEGTGTTWDRFSLADAQDGSYVLRIQAGGAKGVGSKAFPVTPGKTYYVRARVRATGTTGTHIVRMNYDDQGVVSTGQITSANRLGFTDVVAATANTTTWTLYEFEWTAPGNAWWASLSFVNTDTGSTSVYVDDADVRSQATGVMIANGAIVAEKIGVGAITADALAAGVIQTEHISSDAAWVGTISAGQITTGTMDAAVIIGTGKIEAQGAGGAKVTMAPEGFSVRGDPEVAGDPGPVLIDFPTNGNANVITGTTIANTLTVKGDPSTGEAVSFRGQSTIEAGGNIMLADATRSPLGAPTVSAYIDSRYTFQAPTAPTSRPWTLRVPGGAATDTTHLYYCAKTQGDDHYYLCKSNRDGSTTGNGYVRVSTTISSGYADYMTVGCCIIGTTVYVGCRKYSDKTLRIRSYNKDTLAFITEVTCSGFTFASNTQQNDGTAAGYTGWPGSFTTDGTNFYFAYSNTSWIFTVKQYNTSGSNTATYNSSYWIDPWSQRYTLSLMVGSFDFGAQRFILNDGQNMVPFTLSGSTLTQQPNEQWEIQTKSPSHIDTQFELGSYGTCSFFWDGARFVGLGSENRLFTSYIPGPHSTTKWTTESSTWWVGQTFYNSTGPYTTLMGPKAQLGMKKRWYLSITLPASPTNTSRVFIGRGSTAPANSAMYLNGTITGTAAIIDAVTFSSPTTAPTANTFPTATAATIYSQSSDTVGPLIELRGDGYARISELLASKTVLTSTEDVNLTAGNKPPLRIGNTAGSHIRMDGNEIISMASTTAKGSLGLQGKFFTSWDWGIWSASTSSTGYIRVDHNLGGLADFAVAFVIGFDGQAMSVHWDRANSTNTDNRFHVRKTDTNGDLNTAGIALSWLAFRL